MKGHEETGRRAIRPRHLLSILLLAFVTTSSAADPTAEEEARGLPQYPRGFIDAIAAEFYVLRAAVMANPENADLLSRVIPRARRLNEMLNYRPDGEYDASAIDSFRRLKVELAGFVGGHAGREAELARQRAEADKAIEDARRAEAAERRRAQAAEARENERRLAALRAKIRAKGWSAVIEQAIVERSVKIGMTREQAEMAWGKPARVNKTISAHGVFEQWVYQGSQYLYFTNETLTSIQTSR